MKTHRARFCYTLVDMTDTQVEGLDCIFLEQERLLDVTDGRVACRACGSDIVAVAPVGIAAEKIADYLTRWCAAPGRVDPT